MLAYLPDSEYRYGDVSCLMVLTDSARTTLPPKLICFTLPFAFALRLF